MSGKMDDYKTRLQTIYAAIEAVCGNFDIILFVP